MTSKHSDAGHELAELQPHPVDGISAVKIGTSIWAVALLPALLFDNWLNALGINYAPAICVAGVVLGLLGFRYTVRRVKRLNSKR